MLSTEAGARAVSKGGLPDADTYILLSTKNEGGLYGIANGGWDYGYGVCAKNVARRVSINWYETNANYDDDLLTALVIIFKLQKGPRYFADSNSSFLIDCCS